MNLLPIFNNFIFCRKALQDEAKELKKALRSKTSSFTNGQPSPDEEKKENKSNITLLAQDVVLTSIQRHLNVMDVRWTLKQRSVLTGLLCLSVHS